LGREEDDRKDEKGGEGGEMQKAATKRTAVNLSEAGEEKGEVEGGGWLSFADGAEGEIV
jgi:hypothetical protein